MESVGYLIHDIGNLFLSFFLIGLVVELNTSKNLHVDVLNPSTSECDLI